MQDDVNTEASRETASAITDVRCFIPEAGWTTGYSSEACRALSEVTVIPWSPTATSPLRVDVYTRFATLLGVHGFLPRQGDPNMLEFRWSAVRVLLSGVGHKGWEPVAQAVLELDPSAPLLPDESLADWSKALQAAHAVSGIPATLGLVAFHKLCRAAGEPEEHDSYRWLKAAALFHILKHMRSGDGFVRAMRLGQVLDVPLDAGVSSPVYRQSLQYLGQTIGINKPKARNPELADVVGHPILSSVTPRMLLPCRRLSALPPHYLHGAWSAIDPAYVNDGDLTEVGAKLSGVWVGEVTAKGEGKIRPYTGDEYDVVSYAWKSTPDTTSISEQGIAAASRVPKVFEPATLPGDYLMTACPQLDIEWSTHKPGLLSLYDAALASSVVRYHRRVDMLREFPYIWLMPAQPTKAGSTNTGKSVAAALVARALVPNLESGLSVGDSNSAPDNRAIVSSIEKDGMFWLDDWYLITSSTHVLSHDRLQALATGGGIKQGKVMENDPQTAYLRECCVINAKCAALNLDVVNRSIFMYFNPLSDEARANVSLANAISDGRISVCIRLAACYWTETLGLASVQPVGRSQFRFPTFLSIAAAFCAYRTGLPLEEATNEVCAAAEEMHRRHQWHLDAADESGLLADVESKRSHALHLRDLFSGVSAADMELLRGMMCDKPWRVVDLVKMRCDIRAPAPGSVIGQLRELGITVPNGMKNRTAIQLLLDDARRLMPREGSTLCVYQSLVGGDYHLKRETDHSNTSHFSLIRQ